MKYSQFMNLFNLIKLSHVMRKLPPYIYQKVGIESTTQDEVGEENVTWMPPA